MQTYTVSYGTAPASLVVVQGMGRALNPTARSGKPQHTNLSAHSYDNKTARHRSGVAVNNHRTEAFDTPVQVFAKNTGWLTVCGGRDGLTVTYAPDARVVVAHVIDKDGEVEMVTDISLYDYMVKYC